MDKNNLNEKEEFEARRRRVLELSDQILDKLTLALGEVSRSVLKTKHRKKDVEYDEEYRKMISEEVSESETLSCVDSLIDTSGLKQIVATLKDVKDIQLSFTDSADKEDGEAGGVIMISDIEKAVEEVLGQ